MRCFIAVDLDPGLMVAVQKLQEELAKLDIKLVESINLHFTLKFLGEVDEELVKKVNDSMNKLVGRFAPLDVEIANVGVFPNENFIRVVWTDVKALAALQRAVNESLSDYFKKDASLPHLTIARVRSQKHKREIIEFINRHKNIEIGSMKVKEIKLKRSTITQNGAIYEDMAVFRLVER